MRTIIWFFYFWMYLLVLIPSMKKAERLKREGRLDEADALIAQKVCAWCSGLLRLAGVSVTVEGREQIPQGPCLFVSNHQGNFDIPVLLTSLDAPHALVAKMELQKLPLIRNWMRLLGCVFVDRKDLRQSVMALKQAAARLKDGYSVVIFPEGTRSKGPTMGTLKQGAFRIASQAHVPIVPVCVNGSYRVMEQNHNWIRPAQVTVTILPPIPADQLTKEREPEVSAQIQKTIQSSLLKTNS